MPKITKTVDSGQTNDGWIIASTPAVDRQHDRVMPLGIDLTNYQKNPIVIFGHNYSEPWAVIGRAADFAIDMGGLRIKPELREAASDSDPMHVIRALWEQNLLRAASIGFQPLEAKPNEHGGLDYTKVELLEISLVPVPANQEAIRMAVKALTETPTIPQIETNTDDIATATTDEDTELTPEQQAALAQLLRELTAELTEYFIGDDNA